MLAWLSVWSEVQTGICHSWCHFHSLSLSDSNIQIGFTFLVPAYPGSPGKRAIKCVCVCVCVTEIQWQWVNSAAWIEISWPEKTVAAFTTSLLPSVIVKFFPKSLSMIMLFWAPFWLTACNGLRSASSWRQYIKIRTKIQQHWLRYDTQVASWQFLHRRWPLMSSIQHQHSTTQKHNPVLISFRS